MLLPACQGPMQFPFVPRLGPEEQQHVNSAWTNMLTPVGRLDRDLLLDVLLTNNFHQVGVDHLELTSTKRVGECTVRMHVYFEQSTPEADSFTVAVLDRHNRIVRLEGWHASEIQGRLQEYFDASTADADLIRLEEIPPGTRTAEQQAALERARFLVQRLAARQEAMRAATQPATGQ